MELTFTRAILYMAKKCVNNIKNENNYCFIYCFMLHVYNELLI